MQLRPAGSMFLFGFEVIAAKGSLPPAEKFERQREANNGPGSHHA
jgi:hypothetical protein